jgi:hypothetical protein
VEHIVFCPQQYQLLSNQLHLLGVNVIGVEFISSSGAKYVAYATDNYYSTQLPNLQSYTILVQYNQTGSSSSGSIASAGQFILNQSGGSSSSVNHNILIVVSPVTTSTTIYYPNTTSTYYPSTTINSNNGQVTITGINAQISYYNSVTSTYSSSTKAFSGITTQAGSTFYDTFTFSNNGTVPYSVDNISPSTPGFSFVSISPALPYIIEPGSSLTITPTIQVPTTNYAGTLILTMSETGYSQYPEADWDEQLGLTFNQNFTSLGYNVTAVQQADANGCGPGYLLNGLSNTGYWYQIGISYNWCHTTGGYNSGFYANYEVFSPSGASIYPTNGGGGLLKFNGAVHNGDKIILNLWFSNGTVDMLAKDWNTGAYAKLNYSAEGATQFIGLPSTSNSNGFFTGLMTEWYHINQNYGSEQAVQYSPYGQINPPAYLWMDEFYCNSESPNCPMQFLFSNSTFNLGASYPSQNTALTSHGTTEQYTPGAIFTTGST